MAAPAPIKIGTRVEVIGKGVIGTVAFIGTTVFSQGMILFIAILYFKFVY